jgi:hypothetical protein
MSLEVCDKLAAPAEPQKLPFWISWYADPAFGEFELHSPWWISGYRDDVATICAAVLAADEDAAREAVALAYDSRSGWIEFRFTTQQENGWSPFCDRFPRADWMIWPE